MVTLMLSMLGGTEPSNGISNDSSGNTTALSSLPGNPLSNSPAIFACITNEAAPITFTVGLPSGTAANPYSLLEGKAERFSFANQLALFSLSLMNSRS
ncbi:hypothetical protein SDC9_209460 [bioreactor metagenome]|uniref:Uncharacterized protein n=1 Tax=bioreactor metagenome TaxID=1076179 RepID=A0A645JDD7_9ZZZZ